MSRITDATPASALWDVLFGPGAIRLLRRLLPEPVVEALGWTTYLGDGAVLLAIVMVLYWFRHERRRQGAYVVAVGLGGLSIVTGLKALFGRSRPPEDLRLDADFGHGHSFPSSHALGATVVWGVLAAVLGVGSRRTRYAVAAGVIGAVSLSRIVLGVHFLGDVLVGIGVGLVYLLGALRYADDPAPLLWFATATSVSGLVVTRGGYGPMTVGASVGALLTWYAARPIDTAPSNAAMLVLAACCLPAFLVLPDAGELARASPLVEAYAYGVAVGAALLVPAAASRIDDLLPEPVRGAGTNVRPG